METKEVKNIEEASAPNSDQDLSSQSSNEEGTIAKPTFWQRVKEPGSVWQIIIAAVLAIAIGLAVTFTVDEVPDAVIAIVGIPGDLWLRSLKAVVLPLIVTAMILAVQRLREMSKGGAILARWTIGYYIITTLIAVMHSAILVGLVWSKLMVKVSGDSLAVGDSDQETIEEREAVAIHSVVADMFQSLIPANVVNALATDSLLAVLVTSIVVGYLIKGANSSLFRALVEVEKIITTIITFLIKLAPIGVFFLVMPNLFRLDISEIGRNLGVLIGGTLVGMAFHLVVIIPIILFSITRKNPYSYWAKCSPAWVTAWGTASSAATLPVTLKCCITRGNPVTVTKFAIPLGCLINMDGTAIYFPIVVVFLAATQGITLNGADYAVVYLLSTLASIGTTPIPSPIDWFLDRFRTAMNVSGDLFAAAIVTKITGIRDLEDMDV
ncbi:Sodium:dicarboxylate symporter [Clohesyomyces aquaticus]|uniref:Amino acid transporter n=1 Tax=Clohesyomyces aquaticus TaxID=1231657 RepID=A0A1Y2A3W8_9PLEO|nr:Sodium:dicarboxylate symporter [Clohesyomyces aquaticus]